MGKWKEVIVLIKKPYMIELNFTHSLTCKRSSGNGILSTTIWNIADWVAKRQMRRFALLVNPPYVYVLNKSYTLFIGHIRALCPAVALCEGWE